MAEVTMAISRVGCYRARVNLRTVLVGIIAVCFVAVCVLQALAPINFDPHGFPEYMLVTTLTTGGIAGVGLVAGRFPWGAGVRAALLGIAFLIEFAVLATPLNHYAAWILGPDIDPLLARLDRALGFHWPAVMAWVAARPKLNAILAVAYLLSVYQVMFACMVLGVSRDFRGVERLCLAVAVGGAAAILFWTAFPSFGAIAAYGGAPAHIKLALDNTYMRQLLFLRDHGPAAISCFTAKGVVGFPSYHAVESVLACWYTRRQRSVFVVLCALNLVALAAMPVQGGHHLVDLFGGFAVAALSIWFASALQAFLMGGRDPRDVITYEAVAH
jgi:hypothetical protein